LKHIAVEAAHFTVMKKHKERDRKDQDPNIPCKDIYLMMFLPVNITLKVFKIS
jgi:hypothetical protein